LKYFPENLLMPVVRVSNFTYRERVAYWQKELGEKAKGKEHNIKECARRFRYEKSTIQAICRGLKTMEAPLSEQAITMACRSELDNELGALAEKVIPRFQDEKVILPFKQDQQLQEIYNAMKSLTQVHYGWGTARVWNESGISVLFSGPPGTGKTMAAEVMAIKLNLLLYRIDLSQVVNKYIGETEKNLKRLFDAADKSDLILFFDEADSLFGRRTEVKDAHDRYANLEISYLLERMERFKGLAILATNRKKALDEAFLRRLRYIIDFPLPETEQRKKIWHQVIPPTVDPSNINFDFLAEKFPLAGGHIRSIVFNACLQSANYLKGDNDKTMNKIEMEDIIRAVKREYKKLNRSISLEQFGEYKDVIKKMEKDNGNH
jgi:SpoVK/Ycf46/Vps4 family AAA+-type ATPase